MTAPGTPIEISEVDFGDGDVAFAADLPIPPFGEAGFTTEDLSPAAREALEKVGSWWPRLWPDVLDRLEAGIVDHGLPLKLEQSEFTGIVIPVEEDDAPAKAGDIHVSLQFDEEIQWELLLRDARVVRSEVAF